MKKCSKCKLVQALTEFNKNKASKDGHRPDCKSCRRSVQSVYYANHKERIDQNHAVWHENNKERHRAMMANWYLENIEKVSISTKSWRIANPEKNLSKTHRYRARKLDGFIEEVDRNIVWKRDKGICWICERPADPNDWHLEHVIPLSSAGTHEYSNCAVSHPLCNFKKNNRMPTQEEIKRFSSQLIGV